MDHAEVPSSPRSQEASAGPAAPSSRWLPWLAGVAVVCAVVWIYLPTLGAEFIVWDDDDHIYENPHILMEGGYAQAWEDWREAAFYPVPFTMHYVEWRLSDGAPWLFHLNNFLLHAVNGVLAGLLGMALGLSTGVAWVGAALWALHPISVETVAWAAERKNILYVLFYLASMVAYARSLDAPGEGRGPWLAALGLAVLSVLSKPGAVTLPVAIVVLHWVRRADFDRDAIRRMGSFFLVLVPIALLDVSRYDQEQFGTLLERLSLAGRAFWVYVGNVLVPVGLAPMYPSWDPALSEPVNLLTFAACVLLAGATPFLAMRLPRRLSFGIAFYALNIALVSGVQTFPYLFFSFVADHLAYLPSLGLTMSVAVLGKMAFDRLPTGTTAAATVSVVLCGALTWASRAQTAVWHDTEAMWTAALKSSPHLYVAHKNLGVGYLEAGRRDDARKHFAAARELAPYDPQVLNNLGLLAAEDGDLEQAVAFYAQTLNVDDQNYEAWLNLGVAADRQGSHAQAILAFEKAIEINPYDAEAYLNLGAARGGAGDLSGAVEALREAAQRNPRSAPTHYNLALALHELGDAEAALAALEISGRIDPTDPDVPYMRGLILVAEKRPDEARASFEAAVDLRPEHARALQALATAQANQGLREEAADTFGRAAAASGGDAGPYVRWAVATSALNDSPRLEKTLNRAIEAVGRHPRLLLMLSWVRSSASEESLRDAADAVRLAEEACASMPERGILCLETLAMAYDAADRRPDAVMALRQAIELVSPARRTTLEERLHRLEAP